MSPHREPGPVPVEPPDERPVGPCDHCPACGERGGTFIVRTVDGDKRQYRGPTNAIACSNEKCPEAWPLHLHQTCDTCKHRWTVLPVGAKKRNEVEAEPHQSWRAISDSMAPVVAIAGVVSLIVTIAARLLGLP